MIEFTVYGRPQQKGSKRSIKLADGRNVMVDMNQQARAWADAVTHAAAEQGNGELLCGPIALEVSFFFSRPKSHFGSGKNFEKVKPSAPEMHAQTPDLDKLLRTVGDALSGVLIRDDKQICAIHGKKVWTTGPEHAEIRVHEK